MSEGALDPRRHAIRDDLVDARLRDRVTSAAYAAPVRQRIRAPIAPCRRRPGTGAPLDTEFLYGEPVDVFEVKGEWAWVQSAVDSYVGYVPSAMLAAPGRAPTHTVSVPLALVFPSPSIKVPPIGRMPLEARVVADEARQEGTERFHALSEGGFILAQHLCEIDEVAGDWVAVAEMFVGAPYLWGGKTWLGIDCSGLVQLSLAAAGIAAPRDSDMQASELGERIPVDTPFERGDLLFWKGHVGILLDGQRLLHANGYHHRTAIEPVATTLSRLAGLGLPPTALRRLKR